MSLKFNCSHTESVKTHNICIHLFNYLETKEPEFGDDYNKYFTGNGLEYIMLCELCSSSDKSNLQLKKFCYECISEIKKILYWQDSIGSFGIIEKKSNLSLKHQICEISNLDFNNILDIQPMSNSLECECLALTTGGDLLKINFSANTVTNLFRISPNNLSFQEKSLFFQSYSECPNRDNNFYKNGKDYRDYTSKKLKLYISYDSNILVIVEVKGQNGCVVDLKSRKITMYLLRDDYCIEYSNYPISFFKKDNDNKLYLIHGTQWNKLDISDPLTGDLINRREVIECNQDLDYFHCELLVSPNDEWIIDNGWIWGPAGIPTSWNLKKWLEENEWESENGSSKKSIIYRDYYWDGPICWINNTDVAIWGYGKDDESLMPAVQIFDVTTGERIRWFAGPVGKMVYDKYLYSYTKEIGFQIWDEKSGERLFYDQTFCPIIYHSGSKKFISVNNEGHFLLSEISDLKK